MSRGPVGPPGPLGLSALIVTPPDVAVSVTGVREAGCAGRDARQMPPALAVALALAAPALSETDAPAAAKPQILAVCGARWRTMWSL